MRSLQFSAVPDLSSHHLKFCGVNVRHICRGIAVSLAIMPQLNAYMLA